LKGRSLRAALSASSVEFRGGQVDLRRCCLLRRGLASVLAHRGLLASDLA